MTRLAWLALSLWLLPTAAFAVSPDGSTLTAPAVGQSLATSQGVFSFGAPGYPGGYQLLINGNWTGTGSAVEYAVTNGQIYVQNNAGLWYSWNGTNWTGPISAPVESGGGTSPPPPPPASGGPVVLAGSTSLSAPLAPWYQGNSSSPMAVVLPACSSISGNTFFETIGTGPLTLQLSSGAWLDQPPNAQTVGLWVYGPNATAYVSSDGTNCHVSFGGAPPVP